MRRFLALCTLTASLCSGSDWLNEGGDARHSNVQPRGKSFTTANIGGLKLLWKLHLDNESRGANSLTAPVILGRIITHRGIKELIFIGGASGNLFAVDADFGTLFWKRHFEGTDSPSSCGFGLTSAPALAPPPPPRPNHELSANDDDDEGLPRTMRPLYVLTSDGLLHQIRPTTGGDVGQPRAFLPPDANAASLFVKANFVQTATTQSCGAAKQGTWSLALDDPQAKPRFTASRVRPEVLAPVVNNGIRFALTPGSPTQHAVLQALDAASGKELYNSRDLIASYVDSSKLAVANGHVCFGTADNTLYCFGFPVDF